MGGGGAKVLGMLKIWLHMCMNMIVTDRFNSKIRWGAKEITSL